MSNVLGRVATGVHDIPRGPDVMHRVCVKRAWLERGDVVELTLPRNLACASCSGGGCDRCGRSGAVSLRARGEAAPVLKVPLPRRTKDEIAREPALVLRLPEQGGRAEATVDLPRGLLLLKIVASERADAAVRRVAGGSPRIPRASTATHAVDAAAAHAGGQKSTRWLLVPLVIALAIAALAFALRAPH